MKKQLISVLLIIAVFGGCTSKSSNGSTDTTISNPVNTPRIDISPTAQMMPPSSAAGKLNVTIPANSNNVLFSVVFVGTDSTQQVTISGGVSGNMVFNYSTQWTSFYVRSTNVSQTFMVSAQRGIPPVNYLNVTSQPVPSGLDTLGLEATAYSDSSGNKAVIAVQDLCGVQ
jgi:hypothetical protein